MPTPQWITPALPPAGTPCVFCCRKSWQLGAVRPAEAHLRICADTHYRLHLNGTLVGTGPVRGSTTLLYFDCHQVAHLLHPGENTLFVEVYFQGDQNFCHNALQPALWLEIPGMVATDTTWETQYSPEWLAGTPHFTMQSGYGVFRDYRKAALREDGWQNAVPADHAGLLSKQLRANPLPPMQRWSRRPVEAISLFAVPQTLPAKALTEIPDLLWSEPHDTLPPGRIDNPGALLQPGECCVLHPSDAGIGFILDFEEEISGRLELQVEAPAGTTVQLAYGEMLHDGRLKTKYNSDYHFTDSFVLKEGLNTVTTDFIQRGFRMVMVTIRDFQGDVRILDIQGCNERYPFTAVGSFFCSDHKLNRIQQICQNSLSACASDVFMDCPWRERAFWVNDLIVNSLANLHCHGATELHRHCLELVFSQPHPTKLLSAVVPIPAMKGMPDFIFAPTNLFMMLILRDYWLFSGDDTTTRTYLPHIRRILDALWTLADDEGILRSAGDTAAWNFYDWSFELNNYSCNGTRESLLSSLYIIAAKAYLDVGKQLGDCDDVTADELRRRIALTARHFEARFATGDNGRIQDEVQLRDTKALTRISTQLSHALWLLTGEASPKMAAICQEALADDTLLVPDVYLHYFWFKAAELTDANALESLQRIRHYWGRCADTGTTTLYEFVIHFFDEHCLDDSASLCHAFGTVPVAFFHETILGVKPLQPGFSQFAFQPRLLDLEFAEGRIPTPNGPIHVKLKPSRTYIRIPQGCSAILPDGTTLLPGEHILTAE